MPILLLHNNQRSAELLREHTGSHFHYSTSFVPGDWDLIIRWGNTGEPTLEDREVNRASALRILYSRADAIKIMRTHGVPLLRRAGQGSNNSGDAVNRRYRIHMVNSIAIRVGVLEKTRYRTISDYKLPRVDRAIRVARRALYSLGLHFGRVDVGLVGSMGMKVIAITASPDLNDKLAKAYGSALVSYAESRLSSKPISPDSIVLGADPEFMMLSESGDIVFASDYLPKSGPVGCDNQSYRNDRLHYPIAEVRPGPTESPTELVGRIRALLRTVRERTKGGHSRWLAGSNPVARYGIGGHIHFTGVKPTLELIKSLDNYLAIPCMLIEDTRRARTRRPRYGFLGDVRTKPHGGFEYRTPPSWLVSPGIAESILYLAKLIAIEHRSLTSDYLRSPEAARRFYRADKGEFRTIFPNLWADIERTPYYKECSEKLAVLKRLIDSGKTWPDRSDFRRRWGIEA